MEFAATQTKSAFADYRKIDNIETREGGFSLCSCGFNRPEQNKLFRSQFPSRNR